MTTPSVKSLVVIPPSPSIPAVDASGHHSPAWTAFFHQVVTPKINEISGSYISSVTATGNNGINISQGYGANSVTLTFSLGIVTGTSFNGVTGLSSSVPIPDSALGSAGLDMTAARGDHSHPLPASFGTVTSVSVASANGFAGTVATPTSTPVITISMSIGQGSVPFGGGSGSVTQDNANFFYNPLGYGGDPNLEVGPRGSNPTDASFEFYVVSGVTAHFHNVNTTQSITGGVTVGLMYSPTGAAVTSGNRIGSLEFGGSINTSNYVGSGASIRCYTTQNYSATTLGTQMVFQTVPNGSANLVTALTLNQDQSAQFAATVQTAVYAVGSLPAGIRGMRAMVNNALAPVFGSAVVAGGAVVIPVFYNGSSWIVG